MAAASSRKLMNTAGSPWARMRAKLRATISAGVAVPVRWAWWISETVSANSIPEGTGRRRAALPRKLSVTLLADEDAAFADCHDQPPDRRSGERYGQHRRQGHQGHHRP